MSTLVSDIIKISILSLIISAKESNLFRVKLIFKFAKTNLLRLFLRIGKKCGEKISMCPVYTMQ